MNAQVNERLFQVLAEIRPRLVAVSGGVDSLTLAVAAHRQAPQETEIVHAISPAVPEQATRRVHELARAEGMNLRTIFPEEFTDANYITNPPNRCYFCKSHLYQALQNVVEGTILSGANLDDLSDYRPGLVAAKEHDVRHPFIEAKMPKAAVRDLSRFLGLGEIADLPASPCLASRVESFITIDPEDLKAINTVEEKLRQRFGGDLRCRVRGNGVVIELSTSLIQRLSAEDHLSIDKWVTDVFANRVGRQFLGVKPYRMGSAILKAGVK